jgi:hypothetical protein
LSLSLKLSGNARTLFAAHDSGVPGRFRFRENLVTLPPSAPKWWYGTVSLACGLSHGGRWVKAEFAEPGFSCVMEIPLKEVAEG